MTNFVMIWMAILGLAVGSFLNVVIYRVPRSESLLNPGSHCPRCDHAIKNRHNIPVLGWLMLRGRCHSCRLPISVRYPLVEAATAIGFAAVTHEIGLSYALPAYLYLVAIAITLAMIGFDNGRLPDSIVLPSYLVAALLLMPAGAAQGDDWAAYRGAFGMLTMVAVYFALTLVYPIGSGFGDVKIAGLLGLYLGFLGWPFVVIGTFGGVLLGCARASTIRYRAQSAVVATAQLSTSFAPAIITASVVALFITPSMSSWYGSLLTSV